MELIKELPEVFEEFAEQRQKSFMAMKGLKDQGVPVVGAYCTYFPAEIARAMGAVTVGLCSVSDETIPDAEKDLPKNLCPLIKSSYGFAKTDKCPFFYFSDVVVGETTCDGKKKMYEYMSDFKDVFAANYAFYWGLILFMIPVGKFVAIPLAGYLVSKLGRRTPFLLTT